MKEVERLRASFINRGIPSVKHSLGRTIGLPLVGRVFPLRGIYRSRLRRAAERVHSDDDGPSSSLRARESRIDLQP